MANATLHRELLVGFGNAKVYVHREEEQAKYEGERLKKKLYKLMNLENPNDE